MLRSPRKSWAHYDRHSVVEDLHFQRGVLSIRFAGPSIGEREAGIIGAELKEAFEALGRDIDTVLLDFSDIRGMSSLMVGVLGELRLRLRAARARAILCGVAPSIEGLVQAVGSDRRFRLARTDDEVAALRAA